MKVTLWQIALTVRNTSDMRQSTAERAVYAYNLIGISHNNHSVIIIIAKRFAMKWAIIINSYQYIGKTKMIDLIW